MLSKVLLKHSRKKWQASERAATVGEGERGSRKRGRYPRTEERETTLAILNYDAMDAHE